ncbi:MAG TPA: hypothetical protein VK929_09855, partial [Longimicrobiales bacterium]|nr:hypothetical protein [Longimicrobiales bacterium]
MTFLAPFVLAAFIGAGLLFSVEPLVGKLVLPLLGGSPAVWNTCLLFFQVMLLTAYAYAHYGIQFLGIRRHAVVHTFLVAASIITLPPALSGAEPPVGASPVPWLLLQLVGTIGLPFFVLAATAPLVQRWLANSAHPSGRDPYFLYAASNLGSLAGLVAYPFVLEPLWGLRTQAVGWSFAYVAFGGMIAALALRARVAAGRSAGMASDAPGGAGAGRGPRLSSNISIVDALRWTGMAFVPSALLLAVTGYVTTDIAPMPLLWMAPLALYLATFVAAFGSRGDAAVRTTRLVQPVLTLVLAATVIAGFNPLWMLPLHFAVLTVAGYLGHARLAAERPMAARLTEFYLLISLGGTLGGVFGVLIAPLVLMPETEYALLLVAALLLPRRDAARAAPASLRSIGAAVAAAATAGLAAAVVWDTARGA